MTVEYNEWMLTRHISLFQLKMQSFDALANRKTVDNSWSEADCKVNP